MIEHAVAVGILIGDPLSDVVAGSVVGRHRGEHAIVRLERRPRSRRCRLTPRTSLREPLPPKFSRHALRESLLPLKKAYRSPGLAITGPPRVSRSSKASSLLPVPPLKFQKLRNWNDTPTSDPR